ncbi:arylamine N-acetyltransferase family protein [Pseudovibrio sp. WM33]|uniref:arylamine N-acetyltransferase family protein n=1 Tax=Pseudovibrio sp. WM33 TaxID=1735585 RepID=UPI0007AE43D1|nr:arylamine N-acetyltransferase [Pseudovibrio sp. WM33]KZL24681.1 N-hydroxyarylamine O-acetyltransferase [Pseudovibrio sp. WM33]
MDALFNITPPARRSVDWLSTYCDRVGWQSPQINSVEGLAQLFLAHISTFPFDMMDYFLGTTPTVNLDTILNKFLHKGRGGGCSQQNAILHSMLDKLGVSSRLGMARIARADGAPSPRSHMVLYVEMEGQTWLCDAGYGVFGPAQPIVIEPDLVQQLGAYPFKIKKGTGEFYTLTRLSGEIWKPIYRFDLRTYDLQDFGPVNFYNSLSPESQFTQNLIVSRPSLTGGLLIRNNALIKIEGATQTRQRIETRAHLVSLLETHFSIIIEEEDFVHSPPRLPALEPTI